MNTHDYEVTYRNRDDDPWQWMRTCTDRQDAIAYAETAYGVSKGNTSFAVVSVDRETRERVIVYRKERIKIAGD